MKFGQSVKFYFSSLGVLGGSSWKTLPLSYNFTTIIVSEPIHQLDNIGGLILSGGQSFGGKVFVIPFRKYITSHGLD